MNKVVFVSDFDGTITHDDFFDMVIDAYIGESGLKPWHEYLEGKKTHFNALKEIFAKIRGPEKDLERLISTIRVDDDFENVLNLCRSKKIPVYICSAGIRYYIERKIGDILKRYNIMLLANDGKYDKDSGLEMIAPPKEDMFYDNGLGVSKSKLVEELKNEGNFVIFAGDGGPDFEPAKIADVVFAKKYLLKKCEEAGVNALTLNGFADIYKFIEEM